MKINRIFAISLLIAFAHSMAVSDNVIITGDIGTVPDSTVAMLFQDEGRVGTCIALDTIRDGKFYHLHLLKHRVAGCVSKISV